jgi:hypothetical protein
MTARKPAGLIKFHETKEDKRLRRECEDSLTPKKSLPKTPPAQLTGNVSRNVWRETVSLYQMLDAKIVSLLDQGLLVDYCIACEQLVQIDKLRATAMNNYSKIESALSQTLDSKKDLDLKDLDLKVFVKQFNALTQSAGDMIKLDARSDNKRKLLHSYRQALMLTPRSRGRGELDEKKRVQPRSKMDKIIEGELGPS